MPKIQCKVSSTRSVTSSTNFKIVDSKFSILSKGQFRIADYGVVSEFSKWRTQDWRMTFQKKLSKNQFGYNFQILLHHFESLSVTPKELNLDWIFDKPRRTVWFWNFEKSSDHIESSKWVIGQNNNVSRRSSNCTWVVLRC